MIPAFVASCSKAGLAVTRALGQRDVPVFGICYGKGQIASHSRFMRGHFRCTDPSDDEEAFIDQLLQLAQGNERPVLIPSDDSGLVAIARHAEQLDSRFRLCCAPWSIVRRMIEKHLTYEIARTSGVPCPALHLIDARESALSAKVAEAVAFADRVGYPCLIKPSVGHLFFRKFRRKMLMVNSEAELREQLPLALTCSGPLMLCEFIPGDDSCGVNYNSFAIEGEICAEFTAQKLHNKPELIGFPTAVRSVVLPEVQALGRRMLRAIGLTDFSCMEFKRDPRDGIYKLMEVNARHNYSGALALACGINFPFMSYRRALDLIVQDEITPQRENVLWIDEERDATRIARALVHWREAGPTLDPLRLEKVFAVTRLDDPRPTWDLVKSSLQMGSGG